MKYFITADTHFGHGNIIRYCNRPFKDVNQMDEMLIKNWNQRVKPEDTVFILGDFCFKISKEENLLKDFNKSVFYQSQLNGNKTFIKGNHDNNNSTKTIIHSLTISYGSQSIYCVHNPEDANPDYDINFVGHVHNNWLIRKIGKSILYNIGVDMHNYMPITIEEALGKISKIRKSEKIEEYYISINNKEK